MDVLFPSMFAYPGAGFLKIALKAWLSPAPTERALRVKRMLLMQALQNGQYRVPRLFAAPQVTVDAFAIAQVTVRVDADRMKEHGHMSKRISGSFPEFRATPAELVVPRLKALHHLPDMDDIGGHVQPAAGKRKTRHLNAMHITTGLN